MELFTIDCSRLTKLTSQIQTSGGSRYLQTLMYLNRFTGEYLLELGDVQTEFDTINYSMIDDRTYFAYINLRLGNVVKFLPFHASMTKFLTPIRKALKLPLPEPELHENDTDPKYYLGPEKEIALTERELALAKKLIAAWDAVKILIEEEMRLEGLEQRTIQPVYDADQDEVLGKILRQLLEEIHLLTRYQRDQWERHHSGEEKQYPDFGLDELESKIQEALHTSPQI